jgi:predicted YcjX-like family ATPase
MRSNSLVTCCCPPFQMVMPLEFLNQKLVPHAWQPLAYQSIEMVYMALLSFLAHNNVAVPQVWKMISALRSRIVALIGAK